MDCYVVQEHATQNIWYNLDPSYTEIDDAKEHYRTCVKKFGRLKKFRLIYRVTMESVLLEHVPKAK